VLKAAHHGSQTSSTTSFVDAIDPEIVIISVGQNNSFGRPNEDVLGRLINETESDNLYRSDRNGSVEFVTDGQNLWVNTER
jgi:competence protein ComEC